MYLFIATLKVQVQAWAEPEPPLKVRVGPVPEPEPRTSGPVQVRTRFERFVNQTMASLPQSWGGWHITLHQWYNIDPKTGYALKDWLDAWFKESMRAKTAAKRSQQALIAHEYEW